MKRTIKELTESVPKNQITLNNTQLLEHSVNLELPVFSELLDQYRQYNTEVGAVNNVLWRVTLSVMNAILTHERIYFALTRRALQDLVAKDANFTETYGVTFQNTKYALILSFFYNEMGLLKKIKAGTTRSASIYEVVDPDLRSYLATKVLDPEKQKEQALSFSTKVKSKK